MPITSAIAAFRRAALALPNVTEKPHFDRTKFRARIDFASLHEPSVTANVKLPLDAQARFAQEYPLCVYPVQSGFGRMGWTTIELSQASEQVVVAMLRAAYEAAL